MSFKRVIFMMDRFSSAGVEIAYLERGEGYPLLMIHGFASSSRVNWISAGWFDFFVREGRRVIALDNRGHGESGKPYDPAEYEAPVMAEDSRRLLDHLGIERADVVGYSMGARIGLFLTLNHPDRVRRLVLGGVGANLLVEAKDTNEIVAALEADEPGKESGPVGRAFRSFADANGGDLRALASCMRSSRTPLKQEELGAGAPPGHGCSGCRGYDRGARGSAQGVFPECDTADYSQPRSCTGGRRALVQAGRG